VTLNERSFRDAMARFATGVTVVAAVDPAGNPCGMTANSVASVSLVPPMVLVCVDQESSSHDLIMDAGAFAVSVLGTEHEGMARRFAGKSQEERFPGLRYETGTTGSPILEGALAWLDCRVWKCMTAGDHTIVIGEVQDCGAREGAPLVFFKGSFQRPVW